MNAASFRLVAWALLALHLADALLISGGRWLAAYAHPHSAACHSHCGAAAPRETTACGHKKTCCHHSHRHAKAAEVETGESRTLFIPAHFRDGFCEDCAACRHERQSYVIGTSCEGMATEPFIAPAEPFSPAPPLQAVSRPFDSRGPPAAGM